MEKLSDSQILNDWLNTIPMGEYKCVQDRIINECKITKFTFYNWTSGKCRIPELAKDKILVIAGKQIFN